MREEPRVFSYAYKSTGRRKTRVQRCAYVQQMGPSLAVGGRPAWLQHSLWEALAFSPRSQKRRRIAHLHQVELDARDAFVLDNRDERCQVWVANVRRHRVAVLIHQPLAARPSAREQRGVTVLPKTTRTAWTSPHGRCRRTWPALKAHTGMSIQQKPPRAADSVQCSSCAFRLTRSYVCGAHPARCASACGRRTENHQNVRPLGTVVAHAKWRAAMAKVNEQNELLLCEDLV